MSGNDPEEHKLFTSREAAAYINLAEVTLRKWRENGSKYQTSPPYLRLGRAIRYLKKDLDLWLEMHRVDPAKERS